MGLIIRPDDIGILSEAGGTITLGPSRLTIGGQQYVTTEDTDVTPAGLVAETLYRLYAVHDGTDVLLVESANNVNTGPAGYNSWLLIGHFWFSFNSNIRVLSKAVDGKFSNLPIFTSKIFRNGDQAGFGTTQKVVEWNDVAYDDWDQFDTTNFGIRVPFDSAYKTKCGIGSANLAGGDRMITDLRVNQGSTVITERHGGSITNMAGGFSGSRFLNASDLLDVRTRANNDGSWEAAGGEFLTWFDVAQEGRQGLVRDEDL